ncbi:hypothetical protein IT157_06815 [bacterium]|nr:hypothetical protein [bacterium]
MSDARTDRKTIVLSGDGADGDAYASVLRTRGMTVEHHHSGSGASAALDSGPTHAILILPSADPIATRELLTARNLNWPLVPVFFASHGRQAGVIELLETSGITLLPQNPKLDDLDQLISDDRDPLRELIPPRRKSQQTLWIPKAEYPVVIKEARAQFETEFLRRILRRYRGNISKTSRMIDMARRNIQLKIHHYNIDLETIRDDFEDY